MSLSPALRVGLVVLVLGAVAVAFLGFRLVAAGHGHAPVASSPVARGPRSGTGQASSSPGPASTGGPGPAAPAGPPVSPHPLPPGANPFQPRSPAPTHPPTPYDPNDPFGLLARGVKPPPAPSQSPVPSPS